MSSMPFVFLTPPLFLISDALNPGSEVSYNEPELGFKVSFILFFTLQTFRNDWLSLNFRIHAHRMRWMSGESSEPL